MEEDKQTLLVDDPSLSEPMTQEDRRKKLEASLYSKGTRIKSFILFFLIGKILLIEIFS